MTRLADDPLVNARPIEFDLDDTSSTPPWPDTNAAIAAFYSGLEDLGLGTARHTASTRDSNAFQYPENIR